MRALVTGGGGFLGSAVIEMLVKNGGAVRSFSRSHHDRLTPLGVEQFRGDLASGDAVLQAMRGCDIVYHVAAQAGYWGPYREYFATNVVGTRNVINACRALGIARLVYTSSPSVVHTGRDLEGVDESTPVSKHFEANYPATKAIAERDVMAANSDQLATVALRPHLIWGPGDNHLVPRLIERAKRGHLRFIDDGSKLVDVTYIENAARAHILAGQRLTIRAPIAGKAYFISQGNPVRTADFINAILDLVGLPPVKKRMPFAPAYAIGSALEFVHRIFRIQREPRLTRFLVRQFATAHWFDISAARRELGYEPVVSTEEGLERLRRWLNQNNGGGPGSK